MWQFFLGMARLLRLQRILSAFDRAEANVRMPYFASACSAHRDTRMFDVRIGV